MRRIAAALLLTAVWAIVAVPACCDAWSPQFGFTGDVMTPPWSYVYQTGSQWDGTFNFSPMQPYDFVYGEDVQKMFVAPGTVLEAGTSQPLVSVVPAWSRLRVGSCTEPDTENNREAGQGFLVFTAPFDGQYKFNGRVLTYGGEDSPIDTIAWIRTQQAGLLWSGQVIWAGYGPIGSSPNTDPAFSFQINLSAGEKVYFGQNITAGAGDFGWSPLYWFMDVELIEPSIAKYVEGQTYPQHTHSSRLTTTRTSRRAFDDNLTTYWTSQLEKWGSSGYTYPYAWVAVEFAQPSTFNKVDIYFEPNYSYLPKEFAIDIWDDVLGDYRQVGYGKKADWAAHYVFLFPQSLTSRKLRCRTEVMDGFSSGFHTQTSIAELKVINSPNTAGWATVTGRVFDSLGRPVKNAYPYFHILAGADTPGNWANLHYVGTPTDEQGNFTVTVDTVAAPASLGGSTLCVYAPGLSADSPDPDPHKYGVKKVPVSLIPGSGIVQDVVLPGPKTAYTTLGENASGEWLELSRALAGSAWATIPTVMGNPPEPCEYVANEQIVFRLAKQFADGRFDRIYVDVEYLDVGTAGMRLMFSEVPEHNQPIYYQYANSRIRKENTGLWRKQTLAFNKGIVWDYWMFTNPEDTGNNLGTFSLQNWLSAPYDNYIKKVSVRFAPEPVPESVSLTFDAGSPGQHPALRCTSNGLHLRLAPSLMPGNNNPSCIVDNVAGTGRSGFLIDKNSGRSSFYLDIDNNYVFDLVPEVYVTVEFFDNAEGYIQILTPDSQAQYVAGALIQKLGTGTWREATVRLENVRLDDAMEIVYGGGASTGDIQIYDIDGTIAIVGKVTVSLSEPGEPYTPVATIAQVRAAGPGARVELPTKTVTAVFDGYFYIEESDRTSGIRVNGSTTAQVGQSVAVKGSVTQVNGEATIAADAVSAPLPSSPIAPVGVTNKNLHEVGLSTVGLLVRVWGRVVSGAGSNVFEITDGSPSVIKVYAPAGYSAPADGFVRITGVCGLDSPTVPVIRVDSAARID